VLSAVAAVTCAVLAACGDGDPSSAAEAPPANAGTGSGLGAERFEALDAVYAAALPLDRFRGDASIDQGEFAAAARPTTTACNALDGGDRLLAAIRRLCPLLTELNEELLDVGACDASDPGACGRAIDEARATVRRFARLGRGTDRVIARAGLDRACQRALVTPELAYAVFDGYGRALALLERGLMTGSRADVDEAERILTQTDARAARLPDARASLELFRSGCA
jgi:hypothetical protein